MNCIISSKSIKLTQKLFSRTLSILRENFDPVGAARRHELPSTNIIDISDGCCQLAEILKVHLLSGMDKIELRREINTTGLEMKTTAEKSAEQVT